MLMPVILTFRVSALNPEEAIKKVERTYWKHSTPPKQILIAREN